MNKLAMGIVVAMGSALVLVPNAQARRAPRVPHSSHVAEAMGGVEWGQSPKQVARYFVQRIREEYRPRLAKAPGAIEQAQLRHEMQTEIRKLLQSYVRFDGDRTGWDVSFIRDEFTHHNDESMLVARDENSQNFYFFIDGRLWKWYKAFDVDVFEGRPFDRFAHALQSRFGKAAYRKKKMPHRRGDIRRWLEWQNRQTRVRAIDETEFYGFYSLVFEDKQTLAKLDRLRTNRRAEAPKSHPLVDAVTRSKTAQADPDDHPDIVDRITGQIRNPKDAPEEASAKDVKRLKKGRSGRRGPSLDDDPLAGLDQL